MKKFALFNLLLLFIGLSACKTTLEDANRAYDLYRFNKSADLYEELYGQDKRDRQERAAIAFKAGESYRQKNAWRKAERWYRSAIRNEYSDPVVYYRLGQMHNMQQDFDKAREQFEEFKDRAPGDDKVDKALKQLSLYENWVDDSTRYVIEEAKRLNSRDNDYAPSYVKDRKTMIFTSDRKEGPGSDQYRWTGLSFSNLFIAEWDRRGEYYSDIRPLEGNVNTEFNEGVSTFSKRGREMYYTQCNGPEGEKTNCRVMVAEKKGRNGYGDPEPLPFCEDSTVNYANPAISENEKKLFFSSDMEGGEGGRDLYVSHYVSRSRTWGDPVNLGDKINTPGDESFPFVFENNKLYFASTGHQGLGGYDIFVTEWDGEEWSEPENLKYPINSPGDDFRMVWAENGEKGHFSTNREGRGDDIYSFYLKDLEFFLSGTVTNSKTGDTVSNALVTLESNKKQRPDTMKTGEDGYYEFDLDKETRYEVDANKEGFFQSPVELVSTQGYELSKSFTKNLKIEPLPPKEIELEGIYYGLDSSNIRDESEPVLDSLVTILENNPTLVIELRSHTDCRASYEYNDTLSQRRAQSVVDYLINNGIDSARLKPKGYGERKLVNNCECEGGEGPGLDCTEEEHQQNRRTTFKVLNTDYEPEEPELKMDDFDQQEEEKEGEGTDDGGSDTGTEDGEGAEPEGDTPEDEPGSDSNDQ